jgi:hypothetical protein
MIKSNTAYGVWGIVTIFRNNQQPIKTTIKTFYTFQKTKPIKQFWRYLLKFKETQKTKKPKKGKMEP